MRNTAIGAAALGSNTTGEDNVAIGQASLLSNTLGLAHTAIGWSALKSNNGNRNYYNTAIGMSSLFSNTAGLSNTAIGSAALRSNTTSGDNTAIGLGALLSNTSGSENTANGTSALYRNTIGKANTAIGGNALFANTIGNDNIANGYVALYRNVNGSNNIATGAASLYNLTAGNNNTAFGFEAGRNLTQDSSNNILLGFRAGLNLNSASSNNIIIGNAATAADQSTIRIGTLGTQSRTFIAGISGTNVTNGQPVVVDPFGQLGVTLSSRRFKQDIRRMGDVRGALKHLHPVTFRYEEVDANGSKPIQYGLIAEEVQKVMPSLAAYNRDGSVDSVAYQVLPTLLLNAFQEQSHKISATKAKLEAAEVELAALSQTVRLAAHKP
jgi:hypothetical protein